MPHVSLNDLIISVSLNDIKNSDIDRRTVNFFKSCGTINTEYTSFVSEKYLNIAHLYITLSDMIKFFKEEKKWNVTFDSNSAKLLSRNENNEKNLALAQTVGLQIKESTQIDLQLPESFIRNLKDYQKKSVKHLSECGNAANFSVPGSGKTTVAYAAYSILKERGIVDKILVVSPRAAFVPWEEEYKFCFGKPVEGVRLEGSRVDAHIEEDTLGKELVLSTYQLPLKHQHALTTFLENNKVLMILDESHNIKNMDSFLHKKSGKTAETIINLAPSATRRFILSGTPMPNKWDDIWTQFNFLWPLSEILDKAQYFNDYTKTRQELGPAYKKIIDPLFTRIAKKTLNLEEPIWVPVPCPLRPKQQKIYNAIELKTSQQIQHLHEESISESVEMEQWRRAQMIRLIQVASNPALLKKKDVEFNLPPISDEGLDVSELIEKYTE